MSSPSLIRRDSNLSEVDVGSQRSLSMYDMEDSRAIMVSIRLRPPNSMELARGGERAFACWKDAQHLECKAKPNGKGDTAKDDHLYKVNMVLGEEAKQQDVFDQLNIHDLLEMALDGYSTTVFAYGQTGSGKTYTISGSNEGEGQDGLVPRAIADLFRQIEGLSTTDTKYTVRAANFEIYNEQVLDLLNPASGPLAVRWNREKGFYVENLYVVECDSEDDLLAVHQEGLRTRKVASHALNRDSSRSHQMLQVMIQRETSDPHDGHAVHVYGNIYFVDLAGSERLKDTKSTGDTLKETKEINRSLFVLNNVISILSSASARERAAAGQSSHGLSTSHRGVQHVPYRDSKLTKLLMDSLGGKGITLMIGCISPSLYSYEETMSTINYTTRASNIQNRPIVNLDPHEELVAKLRREIRLMKAEMDYYKEMLGEGPSIADDTGSVGSADGSSDAMLPPSRGNPTAGQGKPRPNMTLSESRSTPALDLPAFQHTPPALRSQSGRLLPPTGPVSGRLRAGSVSGQAPKLMNVSPLKRPASATQTTTQQPNSGNSRSHKATQHLVMKLARENERQAQETRKLQSLLSKSNRQQQAVMHENERLTKQLEHLERVFVAQTLTQSNSTEDDADDTGNSQSVPDSEVASLSVPVPASAAPVTPMSSVDAQEMEKLRSENSELQQTICQLQLMLRKKKKKDESNAAS